MAVLARVVVLAGGALFVGAWGLVCGLLHNEYQRTKPKKDDK